MRKFKALAFWAGCAVVGSEMALQAQPPAAPASVAPAGDPSRPVATVNGAPISYLALERALERFPEEKRAEMRTEILSFLVDNILIDQYLTQIKIEVPAKEIEDRLTAMSAEAKTEGKEFSKILEELKLGPAELRQHLTADIRWDKYLDKQATPQVMQQMFDANKDVFDGATVRARHILLPVAEGAKPDEARAQLMAYKADIEKQVAAGLAKLPPGTDNLATEKERVKLLDDAFAKIATEHSTCPSKAQGGDVGFFGREGAMVEPFSKAAFAQQPYKLGEPVVTKFGCHLILTLEKKPGREVKLDDVKDEVKEYYAEKLREHLSLHLRKSAKIQEFEGAKPAPAATPAATGAGN